MQKKLLSSLAAIGLVVTLVLVISTTRSQTAPDRPSNIDADLWLVISDTAGVELVDGPAVTRSFGPEGAGITVPGLWSGNRGRLWIKADDLIWVPVELIHQARVTPLN